MRIGIVGAGAMGMHLAAQLYMAGRDVTLICRTREQSDLIGKHGLDYWNDENQKKLFIPAQTGLEQVAFDIVLITVKQTHLPVLLPSLSQYAISNPTVFVCFQNGMGHEDILRRSLPSTSVFLAVTTEGALKEGSHSVRHTGKGTTWIGSVQGKAMDLSIQIKIQELVDLFSGSGMIVESQTDIYDKMWRKLLVNACINPLTAILKVRNGQLIESRASTSLMERLFHEGRIIAQREGIEIEKDFLQEIIDVCRNTYHNKSSMLQDIEANLVTEIDYINGALKRLADSWGIEAPYNRMVMDMVLAIQEWGRRGELPS
ncbi:MAG TPA: 2-dehydropantoate 2-reductase [Bacillota bacterium]|nr:2-dehydropantoate 2-reductase [Bacillota bacterium]